MKPFRSSDRKDVAVIVTALAVVLFAPARSSAAEQPWEDFAAGLETAAGSLGQYVDQCSPALADLATINIADYEYFYERDANQTAGVCVQSSYMCGYIDCQPFSSATTPLDRWTDLRWFDPESPTGLNEKLMTAAFDPENPESDVPAKIVFPRNVGDILSVVEFAKENKMQVSVKGTGHSYQGGSQKKDSILLNMWKSFPQYTPTGVVNCSAPPGDDAEVAAPCALAIARSKPGYIRIGGGQNFAHAYGSVQAANEALGEGNYKYHLVGGSFPGVGPNGWTMQGGLAGDTGGRLHGFGVDQVLQIDAVLPSGVHVRFGPSEWEETSTAKYPRNTAVTGRCHENPQEEDESQWVWKECPPDVDVDFDELWFAMLGGGGGTYGVVTSLYLQLHDWLPAQSFDFGLTNMQSCGIPMELPDPKIAPGYDIFDDAETQDVNFRELGLAYWGFHIDFWHDPASIGVPENQSVACSSGNHKLFGLGGICYGEGAGDYYAAAWKSYVTSKNQSLFEAGVSYADIQLAHDCIDQGIINGSYVAPGAPGLGKELWEEVPTAFYSTFNLGPMDGGLDHHSFNVLVPKDWVLENKETAARMLLSPNTHTYFAFGGATHAAQVPDAVALSPAHRSAAFMMMFRFDYPAGFFSELYPAMYGGEFGPGFIGSNHANPYVRGPLKSDQTQPCPITWSDDERDEKCVSFQESIYGADGLADLVSIKERVDPDYVLDCNYCVGNNRAKAAAPVAPSPPEEETAADGAAATDEASPSEDAESSSGDADESSSGAAAAHLGRVVAVTVGIAHLLTQVGL
eukprot:CAMPEP_0197189808 /NCGR_PEP_ID=MMETSP1423-20130617/20410_1 /TAXON_ID=476441 /ORGANISM="Pseudo-nitzschia heimii, Strain UNC1101" /LENGTH=798 /DNA_ID=CAMNT_0042642025 /DNA_START=1 /DNA_END=2397 /DNA_ORIENTATION=-